LLRYSAAFGLDSKWSAKFRIKLVRRSVSSLKNIKISQGHSRICNVSRQVFEKTNVGAEGRLLHTIAVLDQTRIRPQNFRKQVGLLFSTIKIMVASEDYPLFLFSSWKMFGRHFTTQEDG
jgi:hypothetical protein